MHSVDPFLTAHTGRLPRPDDLIETVIAPSAAAKSTLPHGARLASKKYWPKAA